jgi:hypothetical protein
MVFEYLRVTGWSGSHFALDFIARVGFWVLSVLALVLVGFKLRGLWGVALALALAVLLFVYNEGMIPFK